jgi:hypothetical protein
MFIKFEVKSPLIEFVQYNLSTFDRFHSAKVQ